MRTDTGLADRQVNVDLQFPEMRHVCSSVVVYVTRNVRAGVALSLNFL